MEFPQNLMFGGTSTKGEVKRFHQTYKQGLSEKSEQIVRSEKLSNQLKRLAKYSQKNSRKTSERPSNFCIVYFLECYHSSWWELRSNVALISMLLHTVIVLLR